MHEIRLLPNNIINYHIERLNGFNVKMAAQISLKFQICISLLTENIIAAE